MNKFTLLFALVFIVSFASRAADLPHEQWFLCSVDEDCVEIRYTCAGGVVNKRFLKEANDYFELRNAQSNCIEIPPTEQQMKVPYKVYCKSKKCGVQGVNPKKPGFN